MKNLRSNMSLQTFISLLTVFAFSMLTAFDASAAPYIAPDDADLVATRTNIIDTATALLGFAIVGVAAVAGIKKAPRILKSMFASM